MVDLPGAKKVSQDSGATVAFPAIVGQEDLKEVLLAVGANDALDGVLIRGEKGTAKSTAARALAELLPEQSAVADCPYGCPPDDPDGQCADCRERDDPPIETRQVPFVTLPLGASRERVVGALSVSDALAGSAEFNPGLLARANRGILYVDEVNLLDDHLVDVLLDAAATGINRVERDGVSVTHPAEITLIGTMNPEEGDLRPQFRDRFALQVEVAGADDVDDRVRVVERALSGFDEDFSDETADVRDRLHGARDRLADVALPESLTREIAELCRDAGVEGHRADIATARAARTLAALDGRETVIEPDVRRAAELALPHRLQSRPFEDAPAPEDVIDEHFEDGESEDADGSEGATDDGDETDESAGSGDGGGQNGQGDEQGRGDETAGDGEGDDGEGKGEKGDDSEGNGEKGNDGADDQGHGPSSTPPGGSDEPSARDSGQADAESSDGSESGSDGDDGNEGDDSDADDEAAPLVPGQARAEAVEPGEGTAPDVGTPTADRAGGDGSGRTSARASAKGRGARVRTEQATTGDSVDAAASVRAAAVRGSDRVESRDLRRSIRTGERSTLVVFAVDASASMHGPMRAAKGVALDLLRDAYEHRDEVAVVTFAGDDADVVLPPTDSVDLAARHLKSLPTGDRTPLPAGLRTTEEVLTRADPNQAVVVVVTDGRATAGDSPTEATRTASRALAERGAHVIVVDAGEGQRASLIPDIVEMTAGERIPLEALTPDRVAGALDRASRDTSADTPEERLAGTTGGDR